MMVLLIRSENFPSDIHSSLSVIVSVDILKSWWNHLGSNLTSKITSALEKPSFQKIRHFYSWLGKMGWNLRFTLVIRRAMLIPAPGLVFLLFLLNTDWAMSRMQKYGLHALRNYWRLPIN
jgi:Predicted phosphatases